MNRKINIIFWSIIYILLFLYFGISSGNLVYTFYFLTFFLPVLITTSWYFNTILIPNFLLKRRYLSFIIYGIYTIIVSLDIELIIVFIAFLLISFYDYENMPAIIDYYKWIPIVMYFIVLVSAFANVVSQLIRSQNKDISRKSQTTIIVRSERKNRIIDLANITYIESMSDYIKVFLKNGERIVTREKISRLHERLPDNFIRIHRSYIINSTLTESFSKDNVMVGGKELPISRTFKDEVIQQIESPKNK